MSRWVLICLEIEMEMDKVAIWPCGTWCSMEERSDFEALLRTMSDDYIVVDVEEWDEDGSPAGRYFY